VDPDTVDQTDELSFTGLQGRHLRATVTLGVATPLLPQMLQVASDIALRTNVGPGQRQILDRDSRPIGDGKIDQVPKGLQKAPD
jgi:hypothetical protein